MGRTKARRIAAVRNLANVVTIPRDRLDRGPIERFRHDQPLTLELGCGNGDYTLQLARRFPHRRFVGLDLKPDRLHRGATAAAALGIDNVLFVCAEADGLLGMFQPGSLEDIWITFPDPHPKPTQAKKRLTAPRFLALYRELLGDDGRGHLKTDDPQLFDFTLRSLRRNAWSIEAANPDIYAGDTTDPLLTIQTTYERRHLTAGKRIRYIRFRP